MIKTKPSSEAAVPEFETNYVRYKNLRSVHEWEKMFSGKKMLKKKDTSWLSDFAIFCMFHLKFSISCKL